jgi:hypothetical protein
MAYLRVNMDLKPQVALAILRAGTPSAETGRLIDDKRNEPIIYALQHRDTGALYFGSGKNVDIAFCGWRSRLRHIGPKSNLNWAFRALYRHRSDFDFLIIERVSTSVSPAEVNARVRSLIEKNAARRGPALDMNAPNSSLDFWLSRLPEGEKWRILRRLDYQMALKKDRRIKRKLMPGKLAEAEAGLHDVVVAAALKGST